MMYLLHRAKEVEPRGRIILIQGIFFFFLQSNISILTVGPPRRSDNAWNEDLWQNTYAHWRIARDKVQFTAWSAQLWSFLLSPMLRWAFNSTAAFRVLCFLEDKEVEILAS